jgi:hypothetical protein
MVVAVVVVDIPFNPFQQELMEQVMEQQILAVVAEVLVPQLMHLPRGRVLQSLDTHEVK